MFAWIDTAVCPLPVLLPEHLFYWGKWDKLLFPFLLLRAIPPSTLHLLTLMMWCWWSCHLKTNSVWPSGSFLWWWRWQSLFQDVAFESAVEGGNPCCLISNSIWVQMWNPWAHSGFLIYRRHSHQSAWEGAKSREGNSCLAWSLIYPVLWNKQANKKTLSKTSPTV